MADIDGVNLKITADASSGVKAVEQVTKATEELKEAAQNIEVKVDGKMDSLGKLHKANGQFMTMGEKMAAQFKSGFMKGVATLAPDLEKIGKTFENGFGKILKGIGLAATAVSGAISLITKRSLSIGGGFEAQMTNVKIISSATTDELNALISKAREMGATLPITAKDAAQAMELLAQRGTKAKDILATVVDVSALAISQQIDMATSADLLGTTMTNFGLSVEDASKITDIFNNASNQSALNISKLVAAMKYVGPAAGSLEIPLEKTVALMEAAANAGLTGEMIGTGLSMVFTKIANASSIMGVSTRNLDGSLRDMADIFSDLASRGMNAAQANTLFGVRAGKTAIALAKNATQLKQNEENLQKWGATQNAVTEKMKTWPNVWNAFISATEELHIEIFEQIKNQSKEAVSGVANLTRAFSDWVGKTQIAGKALTGFLQGLGFRIPASSDFQKILDSFNIEDFVKRIKNFGEGVRGIADSIVGFFSAVKGPLAFLIEHLSAFAQISFWGWIIGKAAQIPAAIMGIATAFLSLYNNLKLVTGLNLASLITLLKNPLVASLVAGGAGIAYLYNKISNIEEAQRIKDEKLKLERETEKLNNRANFEVNFKMVTGFEDLPESFKKATQEMQDILNENITAMQNVWKKKVANTAQETNQTLDKSAQKFEGTAKDVSDTTATLLTKALYGDINAFEELTKTSNGYWFSVLQRLHETTERTQEAYDLTRRLIELYSKPQKPLEGDKEAQDIKLNTSFVDTINNNLKNVFANVKSTFEKSKILSGDNDLNLIAKVSFDEGTKQVKDFISQMSKEFGVPEEIIEKSIVKRLKEVGAQGGNIASGIAERMTSGISEIDNFISKAHDAIEYLNVSPDKFLPALNSFAKGVQKIDPITGKVTERFKKLYSEVKQLASASFGQFTKRIQNMKKAVEGGFMDKSVLEREFKEALARVSVQVQTELQPTKDTYKNQRDYESIVASEVYSRLADIGGDTFVEKLRQEFNGQTGAAMGHAILTQIQKGFDNQVVMKVDGVDKLNKFAINTQVIKDVFNPFAEAINIQAPVQEMTNALNSFGNKLQNINIQVPEQTQMRDYSAIITQIVNEIRTLNNSVISVETAVKGINITTPENSNNNSTELSQVISLVQNLVQTNSNAGTQIIAAINSLNAGETNNYNINIQQEGFHIQKKSDADSLARTMTGAIQAGLGNGGV